MRDFAREFTVASTLGGALEEEDEEEEEEQEVNDGTSRSCSQLSIRVCRPATKLRANSRHSLERAGRESHSSQTQVCLVR